MLTPLESAGRTIHLIFKTWRKLRYIIEAQGTTLLSEAEKRDHIRYWAKATGYRVFVETGTYLGKTTLAMSEVFERCFTVECDKSLYENAQTAFIGYNNITAYHGDSSELIHTIIEQIKEPAIFWLDAHYSGGLTGRAAISTPIEQELTAIFAHPIKDHVILIDDAREFVGYNGYPRIRTLQLLVRNTTDYKLRVRDDIIRIYRDDV